MLSLFVLAIYIESEESSYVKTAPVIMLLSIDISILYAIEKIFF